MPKAWSLTKNQRGFSVVEALLAAAVFGFLVTGLIGAIVYGRASTADAGDHQRAALLAEEGIDATRNIATASYANLVDNTTTNVGDTTIEAGSDTNTNSTSAFKVTTGATGGIVGSVSVYIKTVDPTNKHIQVAVYTDASGAPGAQLGISAIQIATATSWNTFPMAGVTVAGSTNYWIGLSMDGSTSFADGSGGVTAYDLTSGYPASNPFSVSSSAVDKPSFYMTVSATYGLAQVGNQWAFSGTSDVSGIYTRQVTIATASTDHKTVISTVTWPKPGGTTGSVTLTSRLVNWQANIKLWSNGVVAGAYGNGTTAGYRVATQGNFAYLIKNVSGATNLFIVNISNPATPTLAGSMTIANTPTDIFVSGNFAYIANSNVAGELQIIDVTNPAAPTLASTFNAPGTAGGGLSVFVSNGLAYLGRSANTASGELTIVNVANPSAPVQVGIYSNNISMNHVVVVPGSPTYAYIATSSTTSELLILDVSSPFAPTLVKAFDTTTAVAATSVQVTGNTAFVLEGTTLTSVNITTRSAPTQTSTYTMGTTVGTRMALDITGAFMFIATNATAGEMNIVNVANPASMALAKAVDVAGTTSTLNGIAYNSSLDMAIGASASTTQQLFLVTRN